MMNRQMGSQLKWYSWILLALLGCWVLAADSAKASEAPPKAPPVVASGAPSAPASPAALAAERDIQAMQQWWERNEKWFIKGGVAVGVCIVAWLLFALVQWHRQERTATFKCGTLIYTKKGLMLMFAWLLWGDFCFTLMETIAGSVMPWKFKSLNAFEHDDRSDHVEPAGRVQLLHHPLDQHLERPRPHPVGAADTLHPGHDAVSDGVAGADRILQSNRRVAAPPADQRIGIRPGEGRHPRAGRVRGCSTCSTCSCAPSTGISSTTLCRRR